MTITASAAVFTASARRVIEESDICEALIKCLKRVDDEDDDDDQALQWPTDDSASAGVSTGESTGVSAGVSAEIVEALLLLSASSTRNCDRMTEEEAARLICDRLNYDEPTRRCVLLSL